MDGDDGAEGEGGGRAAWRLIERAANSTEPEVDPRLLKAVKSAVRSSDAETRAAVRCLMDLMKKPHSQVRYLSLLIIDELFMRSKLFRSTFVETFDQFLALSVGFRKNMPLPPPSSIASNLRKRSIELLEKWNSNFGVHYRQLRLGFDYLKNVLKFQFPNNLENAARLQRERRERELKTQEILLGKYENLKSNFPSITREILSTIDEINECLNIISEKKEESIPADFSLDDDEMGAFSSLEMRQLRVESMKDAETVHEMQDNKAVFETLRELHKLLVSKHLVSVQEWISVLIRVELSDNRFRDTALKELIDLRNNIRSLKDKLVEMGCLVDKGKKTELEEEEDIWEEGKIEKLPPKLVQTKESNVAPTSSSSSTKVNSDKTQNNTELDPERSKLLSEAPVINWGPSLDTWGSKSDAIANQRGLEIEGHWGRVDHDRIIPQDKIAELSVHRMVYEEEPAEIRPCLAPLKKNGSLCQRKDLKVCPFHGPIIPRDSEGNIIENCNKALVNKSEDGMDGETLAELAKQAVSNVRKRERDEREIKRAKLARVREHNQEVLRESAMASTSYSEDLVQSRGELKTKKPTLASMLKKKVTAKDRIAKKLL